MQLLVKNKLVSINGSSKVSDEEGNERFIVKGKFFSITNKKMIFDTNKNLLYRVRNKYWHWPYTRKAFIYDNEKNRIASIKIRYGFRKKFHVEGYKDEISIVGDFFGFNYSICKNGDVIGTLSKKVLSLTDTYVLDIEKEDDAPFMVAAVIAIDNIIDKIAKSTK